MTMTVAEVLWATRGTLLRPRHLPATVAAQRIRHVALDSRQVRRGSLFVALTGERVDGHDFVGAAFEAGAWVALVASDRWPAGHGQGGAVRGVVIAVANTTLALQQLASVHRSRQPATRLAITGSNGKTTLRHILATVLSERWTTYEPERNLNSDVGLPLAVLGIAPGHRMAVLEAGINYPGEMDQIGAVIRPDMAIITNVGSAHVGKLGTRERIVVEKSRLFLYVRPGGSLVVPEDNDEIGKAAEAAAVGVRGNVVQFGPRTTPGYGGSESLGLDGSHIHWEGLPIHFPLFGSHNIPAVLAAITIAQALGMEPHEIKAGLERVTAMPGRSEVIDGKITILNDAYNANPESMAAALEFFANLAGEGRLVAVLGSMLELGDHSECAHRDLGRRAADAGLDVVFFFGAETEPAAKELADRGFGGPSLWTDDYDLLAERVAGEARPGDRVLLKGSRGVALERLVPVLQAA